MTTVTSKRIPYIDIAKCIGIFLIVLGHMLRRGHILSGMITAGVPLFFFLSGITYHYSDHKLLFWKKKFMTLVIPYLFAGLISIIIFTLLGSFAGKRLNVSVRSTDLLPNLGGLFYANSKTQYMKWNNSLWFIPCLFCVFILTDLLETLIIHFHARHPLPIRIIFTFSCAVLGKILVIFNVHLPWQMETALNVFLFTECGVIFQLYFFSQMQKNTMHRRKKSLLMSLPFLLVGAFCCKINGNVSVRTDEYAFYPLFLISAFACICGIMLLSIAVRNSAILEFAGQHTLAILMWNKFPILLFQTIIPFTRAILSRVDTPEAFACALLPSVISLLLCLLCGKLQERLLPITIGKGRMS
jgi:fucose 4-O-acetylase-like acetyltransferase